MSHRIVFGVVSVVVVAAAGAVGWFGLATTDPAAEAEETVEDYLTAVAAGDVDTALELADTTVNPDHETNRFLTGEVTAGDWSVVSVAAVDKETPGGDLGDTEVMVRVDIPEVGQVDTSFVTVWDATKERWLIRDPLMSAVLPRTALTYYDLNGVIADVPAEPQPEDEGRQVYQLFPGVYRLYTGASDWIDVDSEPIVMFPDSSGMSAMSGATPRPVLTEAGEQRAVEAIEAAVTACVTGDAPQECPVSLRFDEYSVTDSDLDTSGATWQVESAPVMAFESWDGWVTAVDREPGVAVVTIDRDAGGPVTARCALSVRDLGVNIGLDGEMAVVPARGATGWPDKLPLQYMFRCDR